MTSILSRAAALARNPRRIPAAVAHRVAPDSGFGATWFNTPDGSVSFKEAGFVAAGSPAALLNRHNREQERIHAELSDRDFERSLEVGCGFGRLSPTLAKHSKRHTAVDVNPAALDLARAGYPELEFLSGSALDLPFPDGSFDLVVTWTVLQHIPSDKIGQAAKELLRVLAEGGRLLICEETDSPGVRSAHCWHRLPEEYDALFAPLRRSSTGPLEASVLVPGSHPVGTVMVFE